MAKSEFEDLITQLRQLLGRRYAEAAYLFVLEALDYSVFLLGKRRLQGEDRHLTVAELLEGIRAYAAEEFGPLAPYAFRSWGVRSTEDFGEIVFQLCQIGILNRREEDRLEDFVGAFDFSEAFRDLEPLKDSQAPR